MIFAIIIAVLIIEIILASTWNPQYFRKGILVYKKIYNTGGTEITMPEPDILNEKFASSWKPSFVFTKLSNNELAYREKLFQLKPAGYTPILHAYLRYDQSTRKITLKCFANLTPSAFIVFLSYLILTELFSRETMVAYLGILFIIFVFLAVLVGGIAAYQVQQFKLVPELMIKEK